MFLSHVRLIVFSITQEKYGFPGLKSYFSAIKHNQSERKRPISIYFQTWLESYRAKENENMKNHFAFTGE